ncbi:MAG: indole-3-glycerol phosphate synthase TrpC [Alphaproteobacteria bacterium]|nr:indole-3-glycerol phosphate synthase TrpC [Alphaproteobacteria bacterium]
MSDTLERILADKRQEVARRQSTRPLTAIEAAARAQTPPRGFADRLKAAIAGGRYGLIAEIKKASPSRGLIRADFDPASLARAYGQGGATCLSVLTDGPWFQGADADLQAARAAVDLPVLRKDFMLDPYQIIEARAIGADCVLLILAALDAGTAQQLEHQAHAWGMDVLLEVHDEHELTRALAMKSTLIGINNRNLKSLQVDLATTERLARLVPPGRLMVSESGIRTPGDLARLATVGARCFLVGEHLMSQADVTAATRALLAPVGMDKAAVAGD